MSSINTHKAEPNSSLVSFWVRVSFLCVLQGYKMEDQNASSNGLGKVFHKVKPYLAMMSLQFGYSGMYIITMVSFKHGMSHWVLSVYRHVVATLIMAPFAFVLERCLSPSQVFAWLYNMFGNIFKITESYVWDIKIIAINFWKSYFNDENHLSKTWNQTQYLVVFEFML